MKRILSIFLCFVLLFSLSVPAFAEGDVINNYTNETDLTPVTSWLRDIFDVISEKLQDVKSNLVDGFNTLYDQLRERFSALQSAIINKFEEFKRHLDGIMQQVQLVIGKVVDGVDNVRLRIISIYDDFKIKAVEKIEYYFVPTFSMQKQVEEWKDLVLQKFSALEQISVIFSELFQMVETDEPPSFPITYKGVTVGLIDFRPYDEFRPFVHALILGFAWFSFLRRMFYSIPDFIMGMGYTGPSRHDSPVRVSQSRERTIYSFSDGGQRYDVISKR